MSSMPLFLLGKCTEAFQLLTCHLVYRQVTTSMGWECLKPAGIHTMALALRDASLNHSWGLWGQMLLFLWLSAFGLQPKTPYHKFINLALETKLFFLISRIRTAVTTLSVYDSHGNSWEFKQRRSISITWNWKQGGSGFVFAFLLSTYFEFGLRHLVYLFPCILLSGHP